MFVFFTNPFSIALYGFLSVAVVALWLRPTIGLLLGFVAVVLAFYLGYLSGLGTTWLLIMSLLSMTYPLYKKPSWIKLVHALGIFAGCYLFYLHLMPGVYNPLMLSGVRLSAGSWPYHSYLNVDKIFLSIVLLATCIRLNSRKQDWCDTFGFSSVWGPVVLLVTVLMGLGLFLGYVRFDAKIPTILWLWVPTNLLFVCVAEEALCRGFLQKELGSWFKNMQVGHWPAIGIGALAFGGLHYYGGPIYILLSTIAGMGYGYAYFKSKRLESAIAVHFLVNLTHILFFSYPALRALG
ncbi:MAG: CPBP family intramembrane glutamic endopeptidase [Pseudomonadota bacterium]